MVVLGGATRANLGPNVGFMVLDPARFVRTFFPHQFLQEYILFSSRESAPPVVIDLPPALLLILLSLTFSDDYC